MPNVGLRFDERDERLLRTIADRIRVGELGRQHVGLFEQAAEAAHTGEPLVVQCENPLEAVVIADGFTTWGVARPTVEALSG